MMLCFVPPWIEPTVTTIGSSGLFSRLAMVCQALMISAASTIGIFRLVRIGAVSADAAHGDID